MAQKKRPNRKEADAVYLLKIVLYFILGTIWIKHDGKAIFPIGFAVGVLFASQDHFRIDRKVEYALLLLAAVLGLIGLGIFINL